MFHHGRINKNRRTHHANYLGFGAMPRQGYYRKNARRAEATLQHDFVGGAATRKQGLRELQGLRKNLRVFPDNIEGGIRAAKFPKSICQLLR